MTKWRTGALLGASAAALAIALRSVRREVRARRGLLSACPTRALAPREPALRRPRTARSKRWRTDISRHCTRRGIGAASADGPPSSPETASAQVPFESAPFAGSAGRAGRKARLAPQAVAPCLRRRSRLPQRRRRRAFGSRRGGGRSGRAPGARMGGAARRSASGLRRARGLRPRPSDLARTGVCPLPAGGRTPRSSSVPIRGGGVLRRGAAAVERGKARARARGRGERAASTRRSGSFARSGATAISTPGPRARSCATSGSRS